MKKALTNPWYITTILMPDGFIYVGITEEKPEGYRKGSGYKTMEQAEHMARLYAQMNELPMFEEYREAQEV